MASFFPINAPLVNYFFYNYTLTDPGPNIPIAGGKVFFFEDEDHAVPKATYSDVSDANNPVPNTNPLVLNDAGATPLYYAESGLYYIVVTGPDGDLDDPVWTFEHVNFEGAGAGTNVINYVANGQFLAHTDLPATDDFDAGEVRQAITEIAYGNWTFERPGDSTATDLVTFERFNAWSANPAGNPRWKVRIQCTTPDSGDDYKDLRVKFANVNRFASATQQYTFAFSGIDNLAGNAPVDLYLIKNFGTGGSTTTETLLTTFTLGAAQGNYYYAFAFGSNSGQTIGTADDDFVQLALRFRSDEELDAAFTDFQLQAGSLISPVYPEATNQQDIAAAIGGGFPVPNPDGSDLYLSPKLTANGWVYDDSCIGDVIAESQLSVYVDSLHPDTNRLLADGTQYTTNDYSPLGIPYARLQAKYWDDAISAPIYGTGAAFLTANLSDLSPATQLRIATNVLGSTTNTADGTPATFFTFATPHTGGNFGLAAARVGANVLLATGLASGAVTPVGAGTSGFTVEQFINQANRRQIFAVTTTAATGLAGKFFTWSNAAATNFYMWFTVDGVGADPAPGGTGTRVDLKSTYTDDEVCCFVLEAMSGYQISTVVCGAASTFTGGANFTLNTTTQGYYVWYVKDGVGTDPAVSGRIGIRVDVAGTDTAAQVAAATQIAINSKYFAVPDYRGWFLRGVDPTGAVDYSSTERFGKNSAYYGAEIGTFQFDDFRKHDHTYTFGELDTGTSAAAGANVGEIFVEGQTEVAGGDETRPVNAYVNYVILY
jgi:hypothetical protein